ncbi:MAG: hypothetical protein ACO3JL_07295 [Myxococcota bacterium]
MWFALFVTGLTGLVSLPFVHELGHGMGALVVGARRIRLGRRGLDLCVIALLPTQQWRRRVFVASGPLANLVFAALMYVASSEEAAAEAVSRSFRLLAGLHCLYAGVQLLPLRGYDGGALWRRDQRDQGHP